jgi:hypothetical protein
MDGSLVMKRMKKKEKKALTESSTAPARTCDVQERKMCGFLAILFLFLFFFSPFPSEYQV